MRRTPARLIFMCGKMAAGKSTLARALAEREAVTPHLLSLLSNGVSVVLDFPGNTRAQRAWFRQLIDGANAGHELHFVEASDELCRRQLRERSRGLAADAAWTTDAEFAAITARFQAPTADEGFNVVHHRRG